MRRACAAHVQGLCSVYAARVSCTRSVHAACSTRACTRACTRCLHAGVHAVPARARGWGRPRPPGRRQHSSAGCAVPGAACTRWAARRTVVGRVDSGGARGGGTRCDAARRMAVVQRGAHRTRSSSMSQCRCIAAEAARLCTHISTPLNRASSSPKMWRTVSASRLDSTPPAAEGAALASFFRGTQCGIAHQCTRASTPVPVSSHCHACSRWGGSGASSVGRSPCPRLSHARAAGRGFRMRDGESSLGGGCRCGTQTRERK